MSQFVLFKGKIPDIDMKGIKVYKYPFVPLLKKVCSYYWKDIDKTNIWTVKVEKNRDIDYYFTKAQEDINLGNAFEKTEIYILLNEILDAQLEAIFWYGDYYEDLPLLGKKNIVLSSVYEGIVGNTGMCEVYIRYRNNKF